MEAELLAAHEELGQLRLAKHKADTEITQLRRRVRALEAAFRRQGHPAPPVRSCVDEPGQCYFEGIQGLVEPTSAASGEEEESDNEQSTDKERTDRRCSSKHSRGGRLKALDLENLPKQRTVLDVSEDERLGPDGCPLPQIGEDVERRLAYQPGSYFVEEIVRPVYGLPQDSRIPVKQADARPAILPQGDVADSTLISLFVSCFADHLPGYRLEDQANRQGVPLTRGTICRWLILTSQFLEPIADAIAISVLEQAVLHIDDTTYRVIMPEKCTGKAHLGRIWSAAVNNEAWYQYTPTREGHWLLTLLSDYEGVIVGDDYRGHKRLFLNPAIIAAFCWAHVLRKFRDSGDARAGPVITMIQDLYAIEKDIKDQSRTVRLAMRQQRSIPILEKLRPALEDLEAETTSQQSLGVATRYALRLWDGLCVFTQNADVPLDNNTCERGMRRVALSRKNRLFSASEDGAHSVGIGFTIMESCRRVGINPFEYLKAICQELHAGRTDYENLRPAAWAARNAN